MLSSAKMEKTLFLPVLLLQLKNTGNNTTISLDSISAAETREGCLGTSGLEGKCSGDFPGFPYCLLSILNRTLQKPQTGTNKKNHQGNLFSC